MFLAFRRERVRGAHAQPHLKSSYSLEILPEDLVLFFLHGWIYLLLQEIKLITISVC